MKALRNHRIKFHCQLGLIVNTNNLDIPVNKIQNFPYRSNKYSTKNDRLEEAILTAIEYIDNTLFKNMEPTF